jgi:murein DD-endopeptidase
MMIKKWWTFALTALSLMLLVLGLNACFSSGDAKTANSVAKTVAQSTPTQASKATVASPGFGLPINCKLGKDCYVMHYVDRDPSKEAVDFGCGRQTYDGHNGTDFGIANLQRMNAGVAVIAVADGKVLRGRDGVEDVLIANQAEKAAVQGTECGNGLVVDHGNGWTAQYCHLRKGSVVAKPGTPVKKGMVLGMVGSSGLASFPHVHLTVRYQDKVVDPFVGVDDRKSCSIARNPLWSSPINYVPTGLVNAGFAPKPPTQLELWQGKYENQSISVGAPSLLFWVHSYGVLEGDLEKLQLVNPQGEMVIDQKKVINSPARSYFSFGGKRSFTAGRWQGKYQLLRNNKVLVQADREIIVK